MNYFLIFLMIALQQATLAQDLLLLLETEQRVEYQVFLNLNKNYNSYALYLRQHHSANSRSILKEYKLAKVSWSQAQLTEARQHFQNAIEMASQAHPQQSLGPLIFDAHLRIYQLEQTRDDQLILNALSYYHPKDSELTKYGSKLRQKIKSLEQNNTQNLKKLFHKNQPPTWSPFLKQVRAFDEVQINSGHYSINQLLTVPLTLEARYLFTFISNKGMHKKFYATASQLPESFLQASTHSWHTKNKHSLNVYLFKNNRPIPAKEVELEDLNPKKKYYVTNSFSPPPLQPPPPSVKFKALLKNKWFWVGTSALATAIYLSQQNNKKTKTKTVIKDGL